jgi:hypothetical protein
MVVSPTHLTDFSSIISCWCDCHRSFGVVQLSCSRHWNVSRMARSDDMPAATQFVSIVRNQGRTAVNWKYTHTSGLCFGWDWRVCIRHVTGVQKGWLCRDVGSSTQALSYRNWKAYENLSMSSTSRHESWQLQFENVTMTFASCCTFQAQCISELTMWNFPRHPPSMPMEN